MWMMLRARDVWRWSCGHGVYLLLAHWCACSGVAAPVGVTQLGASLNVVCSLLQLKNCLLLYWQEQSGRWR